MMSKMSLPGFSLSPACRPTGATCSTKAGPRAPLFRLSSCKRAKNSLQSPLRIPHGQLSHKAERERTLAGKRYASAWGATGRGEQLRRTGLEGTRMPHAAWRRADEGEGWVELGLISITSLHMRRPSASAAAAFQRRPATAEFMCEALRSMHPMKEHDVWTA